MNSRQNSIARRNSTETAIVSLPQVIDQTAKLLNALTEALGLPRDVLASDDHIMRVWNDLPDLIGRIPRDARDEGLAKMCVAIANGLFDSAINYIWNAAIIELREKVRRFGVNIIPQITDDESFDENKLLDLRDSDLLRLCLNLNLISVNAYFMLDQCRDIRNNFSSAHPPKGQLDEYELLSFLNRVSKYALSAETNPQGVDVQQLIVALDNGPFSAEQRRIWCQRIEGTYEAQRATVFGMLHGMYCDPDKPEHTRVNALGLCNDLHAEHFTPSVKSLLINRHHDYLAKGDSSRNSKSREFFESLGLLSLLSESEFHSMVSNACKSLLGVHVGWDNFRNEPPFAERLLHLRSNRQIPETAKAEFVETVVTCSIGNQYGVSHAANVFYLQMVRSFSAQEIQLMLDLPNQTSLVKRRICDYDKCRANFIELVRNLDQGSILPPFKARYEYWLLDGIPF